MDTLRSLSGKLALQLLASNNTQTAEVIGLLLARWLLGYVGILADHVVIPLDAHRMWFAPPNGPVKIRATPNVPTFSWSGSARRSE